MGSKSSEPIAVTGDGHIIKKGSSYYYGDRKVKVISVDPYRGERQLRVQVKHLGYVYADNLFKSRTGKYIGAGD